MALSIRDLLKTVQGFAGGNLQGQLGTAALHDAGDPRGVRVPAPVETRPREVFGSPIVTPTATRERTVTPAPIRNLLAERATSPTAPITTTATPQSDPTMRPMQDKPYPFANEPPVPFGASGEPFQSSRVRRTNQTIDAQGNVRPKMRDYIADDAQYLRDREAQPLGPLDKVLGIIGGLNANRRGEQGELTGRDRDIGRATRSLGREMAVEKQNTATAAREAAILAGQERVRQGDERIAQGDRRLVNQTDTLTARKERWKQMGQHERVQDALRVYNSGGANDPETLAAISETIGLPNDLKPKFNAGEIVPKVNDDGEITLIDKRDGSVIKTGVKDYETVREKGRMLRQERAARAAMQRTEALIAAGVGKLGDPVVTEASAKELEDKIEDLEEDAAIATEKGFPSQAAKILGTVTDLRKTVTNLKEAANKARTAQGTAAPKQGLSRATFVKNNPKATAGKTPAEIDAMIEGGGYKPLP